MASSRVKPGTPFPTALNPAWANPLPPQFRASLLTSVGWRLHSISKYLWSWGGCRSKGGSPVLLKSMVLLLSFLAAFLAHIWGSAPPSFSSSVWGSRETLSAAVPSALLSPLSSLAVAASPARLGEWFSSGNKQNGVSSLGERHEQQVSSEIPAPCCHSPRVSLPYTTGN